MLRERLFATRGKAAEANTSECKTGGGRSVQIDISGR
jgi:hypothetical protein